MIHQFALNVFAGFLAGLLCALGGTVKDAPYEGFKPRSFVRSPIVGTLAGAVSFFLTRDFFLALAFSGYVERCCVEGWKIMRAKRPGKFDNGEWGKPQPVQINGWASKR